MPENKQPWDAVFDRIRVLRSPENISTGLVTNIEFDTAETVLNVRLPPSYRSFAFRFGLPGGLMNYLRLDALVGRKRTDSTVLTMTRWVREDVASEHGADAYCSLERIRQFVVFGDDGGGGWFVFDTTQLTSLDPIEYRIYWVPKHHGAARSAGHADNRVSARTTHSTSCPTSGCNPSRARSTRPCFSSTGRIRSGSAAAGARSSSNRWSRLVTVRTDAAVAKVWNRYVFDRRSGCW